VQFGYGYEPKPPPMRVMLMAQLTADNL